MIKTLRTKILGALCILWALRSMTLTWIPVQTWKFHLLYVWTGQEALLIVGLELILIRHFIHKNKV